MLENYRDNSSINHEKLLIEHFLKSNNLVQTQFRQIALNLDLLKNKTAYVLYNVKNNTPRLERITANNLYRFELPISQVLYSYLPALEHDDKYYVQLKIDELMLKQINNIVYQAQKQINHNQPYLVRGYFYDAGVYSGTYPDLHNKTRRIFGLIFYEEDERYHEPLNHDFSVIKF